jgi:hypothetical protein
VTAQILLSSRATRCDAAKYVTSPSSCCPKEEKENLHVKFILKLHFSGFNESTHILSLALHCNANTSSNGVHNLLIGIIYNKGKGKVIPVTDREGP